MTDTNPRDLIKFLIDALKEECNWIDNPKHDELIAQANAYLTQHELEVAKDEELNSKSSPNNLQIRSSDITPPPVLVQQWMNEIYDKGNAVDSDHFRALAARAAQWGANAELDACCEWLVSEPWFKYDREAMEDLRAARRPKPKSLKEQALIALDDAGLDAAHENILRRALEALPDD